MIMSRNTACFMAALCAAAAAAQERAASESAAFKSFSVGLKAGSLGVGADVTVSVTERVHARLSGNYLPLGLDNTIGDVNYDGRIRAATLGLLADFYPFDGRLRFSAGFFLNGNEVELDATPNESLTLGDHTYTPAEIGVVTAEADFRRVAPYIGLGYGAATGPRNALLFVVDAGLLLQGPPDLTLSANGTQAQNPVFQADLKKREDELVNRSGFLRFYPVLSFGVVYNF